MELDLIIARCNADQNIENSEIQKMIACISYFMK